MLLEKNIKKHLYSRCSRIKRKNQKCCIRIKEMELHSYAKRRTPMKWTIEQKRKLVEARIAHDAWFTNKPSSVVPWKNILITAKLDDFNVFFVRKQWSSMLERYKQYKRTRLGNNATKAIDAEQIKRINQEWEFFEPIHKFMTRKTTNLHSYALTHRTDNNSNSGQQRKISEELVQTSSTTIPEDEEQQVNKTITKLHNETNKTINFQKDCAKENIPNNTTIVIQPNNIAQDGDDIHLFSSDTDEEFQIAAGTTRIMNVSTRETNKEEEDENINCVRNTDHDFYSKKTTLGDITVNVVKSQEDDLQEQQSNYFADASEESQASTNMVMNVIQSHAQSNTVTMPMITIRDMSEQTFEIKSENVTQSEIVDLKEENQDQEFLNNMPSTSTMQSSATTHSVENLPTSTSPIRQSERDKYYRHKRHFNRRLEKRFDAILQVMSQIVKVEYPSVDVTPLMGAVNSVASNMAQILGSDSEDDNQSDEIDNIPTTTNENK